MRAGARLATWSVNTAFGGTSRCGRPRRPYVAVFNLGGPGPSWTLEGVWKELGIPGERWTLRDLGRREDLGADMGLRVALAPHASALFQLSAP